MKKLFFYFLMLLISINSFASHIIGGGIQITKQSGGYYKFEFQMYVDAIHADPGVIDSETAASLAIFDKGTNSQMATLTLPRVHYQVFTSTNSCSIELIKTGVITFSQSFFLDPTVYNNTLGYYVIHQNCCRPNGVLNINDSYTTPMTFYNEFPPLTSGGLSFINSSPRFPTIRNPLASLGNDFLYDFSNTDPDGDSLAYHLVIPLAGQFDLVNPSIHSAPYDPIVWETGYSLSTIIPGTIPLEIDVETGILKVNANLEGMFAFAVETEEYRDGVKIGSAIRESILFVISTGGGIDCVNGTQNFLNANRISIAPNPCKDQLKIELNSSFSGLVEVEVINSVGMKAVQKVNEFNTTLLYNTSALSPGIYFLVIRSDSQILTGTFIKE